jgi:acyl-CoA dehydrogenase
MAIDNESFELLVASVQRFVRERLVPAEDAVEEHDEVPSTIVDDMKAMGLFGLSIPEEYDGIGLSMSQECRVAYEVGQTSLAFRSEARIPAQGRERRADHVLRLDRARRGQRLGGGQDAR